jgi:ADP-ribose pyrophosphatase
MSVEEKKLRVLQEFKGNYLTFRKDEVELSTGDKATREMVLHPGAVAILALNDQDEAVLVRQYRYPVQEVLYEIPAGKLEKGEDPLNCAQRELAEETGFRAEAWEKVASFYTAPGFTNELMHLFLARELTAHEARPDPDEIIAFETLPVQEIRSLMEQGRIKDAKTLIAFLWYFRMKDRVL